MPKLPEAPAAPAAPAAPVKPAAPAAPAPATAAKPPGGPAPQKPLAPKKETTRITLPPDPKTMPKATVKLNQTVPLSAAPAPAIKTANVTTAVEESQEEDPFMLYLSIAAIAVSIFAFATAFIAG